LQRRALGVKRGSVNFSGPALSAKHSLPAGNPRCRPGALSAQPELPAIGSRGLNHWTRPFMEAT